MVLATALTGGLAGCGGVTWTPDAEAVADPSRTRPTSASPAPVTPVLPTSTPTSATPTTAPTPRATPTPRPTSTPRATTTPRATPTPAPSASKRPKPKTAPTPKASQPRTELRLGDRGPEVLALQQRLSALGYWLGEPDGHYGSLTQQAVWALQKTAGISRDGRVGPSTQRALDRGVRPTTRLAGNGIDIDLHRQVLLVVRGGQVKHVLNTSTGGGYEYERKDGSTATARTPKGSFRVYHSVDGRDEGFLGEMWRPRYFKGGYAVHGSPSIPPHPASHGCARLSNAAMNLIWARDYMPMGSTVLVR
ncbi:endopeptidase [Knoellia flava TL1]|uniref:Endopeptidase n=1 Tax=Knoellia flava TL1 TaxID=1385518 RepID=A0ABR4XI97_9MICO|nr:endopeptidase [Knoellia flava TL1]